MKLKLFLTFDHELPLGGVRTSWNDALFEPTNKLYQLANELDVPVVLFTDVLCGLRFKEWDLNNFYLPYIAQLHNALKLGNDVQLHLHPHWLTSRFEENRFFPSGDFSLSNFADGNRNHSIGDIVKMGVDFLQDNLKPSYPDYKCIAFRAGGYNLGEGVSSGLIIEALRKNGIKFDSSISKGYYFKSAISEVNFSNMPEIPNWYLNEEGILGKPESNGILEIPIASIPKSPFEVPTMFKMKKMANRAPANNGFQIHEGKPAGYAHKFRQLFSSRMLGFDNYTLSHEYLMKILDYNVRKYRNYDEVLLSVSGHPKSMGAYSFEMMKVFVNSVREKYPDTEFLKFSDLIK
jgi:hypothetical protein